MASHALIIGIDRCDDLNIPVLTCAEQDARSVHRCFQAVLGYGTRARLLLSPRAHEVTDALKSMGAQMRAGDRFLLYFAGHGRESADAADQYLLMRDAEGVILESANVGGTLGVVSLGMILTLSSAWPNVARVMIFDACRSPLQRHRGSSGVRVFGADRVLVDLVKRDFVLRKDQFRKEGALGVTAPVVMMKACAEGGIAQEVVAQKGGLFSLVLVQLLTEAAKRGEAVLTGMHLQQQLTEGMARKARENGLAALQQPWLNTDAPEVVLFNPNEAPGPSVVGAKFSQTLVGKPIALTGALVTAVALVFGGAAAWRYWQSPEPPADVPMLAVTPAQELEKSPIPALAPAVRQKGGTPPTQDSVAKNPSATQPSNSGSERTVRQPSSKPTPPSQTAPRELLPLPNPAPQAGDGQVQAPAAQVPVRQEPWRVHADLDALPPGRTAVMAVQGPPNLVAQLRRHLPPSQLRVFKDPFYQQGLFEQALNGDGSGIAKLGLEARVSVVHALSVSAPTLSGNDAQATGVRASVNVQYRRIDPATGGTLHSANLQVHGSGFSPEAAQRELQRTLDERAAELL